MAKRQAKRGALIGRRIYAARFARVWKQADVVRELAKLGRNISPQSLSQWEKGQRDNFTPDDLNWLALALGVPVEYFTADDAVDLSGETRITSKESSFGRMPYVAALDLVDKPVEQAIKESATSIPTRFEIAGGFATLPPDAGMAPLFKKGETPVFLARGLEPRHGDVVLVKIGDGVFLRHYSSVGKRVLLSPTAKGWSVADLSPREWKQVELIGIACPVDAWLQRLANKT